MKSLMLNIYFKHMKNIIERLINRETSLIVWKAVWNGLLCSSTCDAILYNPRHPLFSCDALWCFDFFPYLIIYAARWCDALMFWLNRFRNTTFICWTHLLNSFRLAMFWKAMSRGKEDDIVENPNLFYILVISTCFSP